MDNIVRTREIAEAAIYYSNGIPLQSYKEKYWYFVDSTDKTKQLRLDLINRRIVVEPLEFMDVIRRIKGFSNEGKMD